MYETSLHTLQPDQGINQKQNEQSFPQNGIQYPGKKDLFHVLVTRAGMRGLCLAWSQTSWTGLFALCSICYTGI